MPKRGHRRLIQILSVLFKLRTLVITRRVVVTQDVRKLTFIF